MSEETKVEVSKEMDQFISYVENLTVLELSTLVKALEDRLGVTAAAPVAVAAAMPAGGGDAGGKHLVIHRDGERQIHAVAVSRQVRVGQRDRVGAQGSREGGKRIADRGDGAIRAGRDRGLGPVHNRLDGGGVH